MDYLKRLFGAKPANGAPALSSGATAPQMPAPAAPIAAVGGRRRRSRKQARKDRKQSRKNGRK